MSGSGPPKRSGMGTLTLLALLLLTAYPAAADVFYFPHYADGGGFQTRIVLTNESEWPVSGMLSVYDSAGQLQTVPFESGVSSQVALELFPYSTLVLSTKGSSEPIRTGYIEVYLSAPAVSGLLIFKHSSGTEASVLPTAAAREYSLFVERSPAVETGIAVFRTPPAPLEMRLFDLRGRLIAEQSHDPGGVFQLARFVYELLPVPVEFQGRLVLKSDSAFVPLGLRFGPSVLSTVPLIDREQMTPGAAAAYFVDGDGGNDSYNGLSPGRAWRSLEPVNRRVFGPGDRILFKAGTSYTGRLRLQGSGSPGSPAVVDMYGEGARPRIDGNGLTPEALLLYNVEQWEINNLEITNTGPTRAPGRKGVYIHIGNFGTARHVVLRRLHVHDVNGSNVKDEGGGAGIQWYNEGGDIKSRFDDLVIEDCHLQRTDRNGIIGSSAYWRRDVWHPSLNVVIRGNLLEDIGGDGIVPIGCDGAVVERNTLRGGRQRAEDYAAGIWPWSCDNTIVQFNEVSGMKGTKDGQGYDSDWNCRNSLFQYNYSHDNEGGFMLICDNGNQKMPVNAGNSGTVVRYNISQNDGARTFHISGPCRDIQIYNNDFYVGAGTDIPLVLCGNWGGDWSDNIRFANNIFYVDGRVRYEFGGSRNNIFENNVFYGNHVNPPFDPRRLTGNPMLANPGSGATGLESLQGYRLMSGSPCIGAGIVVWDNGGRDFWGNPVPSEGKCDIGAHSVSR